MALHHEVARVLSSLPAPEPGPIDPATLRAAEESQVPPPAERSPQLHAVTDGDADGVPVRVYRRADGPAAGVVVYVHGGAFFLGSLETHDHVARSLAEKTGAVVVSVGYRRAPEHAFPAGLDDTETVVRWASAQRAELDAADGPLALVGDSSGGTFVAAVTARLHDAGDDLVTHQILLYPSLDLHFDVSRWPSLTKNAEGYGLETAGLKPFNAFYLESGADADDPLVSPIEREDLTGLPPALVVTAEHDPLRDEGEAYGRRLEQAGVRTTVRRYKGAGHGFVQHFGWIPEFGAVFDEIAEFVRS